MTPELAAALARSSEELAQMDAISKGAPGCIDKRKAQAVNLAIPVASTTDGAQITVSVGQHMAALRKLAAAHKRAGPTQRPKIRKAMAMHARAIQSYKAKSLAAATSETADLAVPFDESKHPRVGGKFAPKGTQTQGAQPKPPTTGQINPALAAQIRDFQKRMGLPVTGNFDQATVAKIQAVRTAKGGGGGGGGGKGKGGGKGGASKGGAAAKKQQAAAKAYLKAQQTAAKKAAAQQKAAAAKAAKPQSAATKLRTAASKSPALQAYLKASAAAHNGQVAAGKARTAQKAAATASNVKATAAVAAKLAHH